MEEARELLIQERAVHLDSLSERLRDPRVKRVVQSYREIIARVLSEEYQLSIPTPEFLWQSPDGRLDLEALMRAFQRFWRRNADIGEEQADYTEAFPHLLLMAEAE
jgi:hypothetical protein